MHEVLTAVVGLGFLVVFAFIGFVAVTLAVSIWLVDVFKLKWAFRRWKK